MTQAGVKNFIAWSWSQKIDDALSWSRSLNFMTSGATALI